MNPFRTPANPVRVVCRIAATCLALAAVSGASDSPTVPAMPAAAIAIDALVPAVDPVVPAAPVAEVPVAAPEASGPASPDVAAAIPANPDSLVPPPSIAASDSVAPMTDSAALVAPVASMLAADSVARVPPEASAPSLPPAVETPAPAVPTASPAFSRTVAVLAFTGAGIDAKDLAAVTSRFETELLATDSFKVVERRNMDRILQEQGFQQSGACDNSECSVQIGQILSVGTIFTGELARVGKTWSLSVKRTDVATGQTVFSHALDIRGGLEDVLRGGCAELALIASGRRKPDGERSVLVARRSNPWPWIAGGAVLVGGGVVAAILLSGDESSSASAAPTQTAADDPDQLIVRW